VNGRNGVPPRALTIAGSDSGGGAGIQADLKTFFAHGVHGTSAVTAVTVQNSLGVSGVYELPAEAVAEQIEAVVTDIGTDAVKIGMLSTPDIIEAVAATLERLEVQRIVLDPVAVSKHGDPLLRRDAVAAMKDALLPLCDLVTPNLGEASLLTGREVTDRAGQLDAARALHDLGAKAVLVKGGHLAAEDDASDLLYDGEHLMELRHRRIDTVHTHGTGCTLSAAIAASLALGADLPVAVRAGKRYVTAGIEAGYPLGKGIGPVGHFWRLPEGGLPAG
jgi:hydroxymethylpyrimidine/phosphomethylpyrimidine kinase